MKNDDLKSTMGDVKDALQFYIRNEVKRKFIGETYSYLIKIPSVIFWIVTLSITFLIFTLELILAGVIIGEDKVHYNELLLGFTVAIVIGLVFGQIYSRKVAKKIHEQIAEELSFKFYKSKPTKKDKD